MVIPNILRMSTLIAATVLAACVVSLVITKAQPAEAAFPGKNGKIAFVRERAEDSTIFTIDPGGTGLASTRVPFAGSPAWSPDGKRIAFDFLGRSSGFDIYVMKADGSEQMRITRGWANDFAPSWSPDSKRIAFSREGVSSGAEIYSLRIDGTGLRKLTNHPAFDFNPAWSPNGKKIAFSRQGRTNNVDIFTMNADGSGKRNLTQTARVQEDEANWSPDSKKIAFSKGGQRNGEVFVMNADGSGRKNLTRGAASGFGPAWSPDGKKIAFASFRPGNAEIFVMRANGTDVRRLTKKPAFDNYDPDWQPLPYVKSRVTKCSQKQAAAARQVQRGDARADRRRSSAALISQKRKIHQKQVNACRHGKATGGNIRLRR